MDKQLQMLALCRRAGKLVMGFDAVKESAANAEAYLLAISKEISPKTRKEMEYLKQRYQLPMLTISAALDDLWYILGKRSGVFSVTDRSLAQKLMNDASSTEAKQEEKL